MLGGFGLGKTLRSTIVNATAALFNDYTNIPLERLKAYFNFGKGNQFDDVKKLEFVGEGSLTNSSLSNQNVEIPSANLKVGATQDFSLMFWFKSLSAGQNTTLVDCVDSSASSKGFKISLKSNGRITCSMKDDDGTTANDLDSGGSTTNDDGLWHHFAASFNRDGSRHFYIDGELDRSKGISGLDKTIDVDLPWHLMNNNQVTVGNNGFLGSMKNFAVWHRVLTQNEIQNIRYKKYEELKSTETVHLKGWYPLESNANDSTGNQNATVTGGTNQTFNSSKYGLNNPTKPRGKDNSKAALADSIGSGSASFDGTDDYINLGSPSTGTGIKTLSMWVKANTVTSDDRIISNLDSPNFSIRFGSSDVELWGGSWVSLFTNPSAGAWTHFAFVFDGSTNVIGYKDGVAGSSVSTNYDFSKLGLGATFQLTHGNHFDGNIAQVGYWSRALTQEEIQEISQKQYSELTTSEKTNLVSWWGLDSATTGQNQSIVLDENDTTTTSVSLNGNESALANITGTTTTSITGNLTAGKLYKLVFTKAETLNSGYDQWREGGGSYTTIYATSALGAGTYTLYFQAVESQPLQWQSGGGTPWQGSITNISLEEYDGNPGVLK
jgi:hypothetical protein